MSTPGAKAKAATVGEPLIEFSREVGTYTAFGYRSARVAARDGRTPSMGGGVAHELLDRLRLQTQSREFKRDNGIYAGMIRRARSFIIGPGFKLQCKTADPKWNADREGEFAEFWRRPEISGLLSGYRCETMFTDEVLTTGEGIVILTDSGKIQLVEAEQLRGENLRDSGIERDLKTHAPVWYTISPYRIDGALDWPNRVKYPASSILYASAPDRPSSDRAVPPCQASFPMLHRINDVCDSEAIAWQLQSKLAVAITRKESPLATAVAHEDDSVSDDEADGSPSGKWVTEWAAGIVFHGEEGEEIKGIERTAPAKNFRETLSMFFRLLGLPLGLPLELTLLDWTQSNYSQSRAVLEQAKVSFLEWQQLLEEHFYRAIFLWWLDRQVAMGLVPARPDMKKHEWIKPAFPWIDQLAEAQAHGENVERGFETFNEVCKSRNTDRESHVTQLRDEAREAAKAARELKSEFPEFDFHWQPFAGKKPPTETVRATSTEPPDGGTVPKPGQKPVQPAQPGQPQPPQPPGGAP